MRVQIDIRRLRLPSIPMEPGMIDMLAHDPSTDEIVLVAKDRRPWDGSSERLVALEEKLNTYASFLLDGELAEAHPELVGKRARIELRCAHVPDESALNFLERVHDQLAFQHIKLQVVVKQIA